MKIKTVKLKDTDNIFITYKGFTISHVLNPVNPLKTTNNLGFEIDTDEEKREFIGVLKWFIKELERLEF